MDEEEYEPSDLCRAEARRKSLCGTCTCRRPYGHKGSHYCVSCGWIWGPKPYPTDKEKEEANRL